MDGRGDVPMRPVQSTLTFAQRHDRQYGGGWEDDLVRHISPLVRCLRFARRFVLEAARTSAAQGLYRSWRDAARVDRSLEILGLHGWRRWAGGLPERPAEAS